MIYCIGLNRKTEWRWARLKGDYPSIRFDIYEKRTARNGQSLRGKQLSFALKRIQLTYRGWRDGDWNIMYEFHRSLLKYDLIKKINCQLA